MGGIEKITGKIMEEADAFENAALENAEKEADRILNGYKAAAEESAKTFIDKARKNAENIILRAHSGAELVRRNTVLKMKSDMVEEVYKHTVERIINQDEKKYTEFLAAVMIRVAEDDAGEVIMNEKDRTEVGGKLISAVSAGLKKMKKNASLSLSADTADISGGFILRYGEVETNCSVEQLVKSIRTRTEPKVVQILFSKAK